MITVAGHPIDRAHTAKLLADRRAAVERRRADHATELKLSHLYYSTATWRSAVDLTTAIEPTSPDLVGLTRFVCAGAAAIFTYSRRRERDHWTLAGRDRHLVGEPDPEWLDSSTWEDAFWFAWAIRDAEALALLVQVPVEQILERESFDRPLVHAIQSMFTRAPDAGAHLVRALELADPERLTRTDPGWLLDCLVPVLECFVPIVVDVDASASEAAVRKLLELHRTYQIGEHPDGVTGNVSSPALGLIAWGRTIGLSIDVTCPYTPPALLDVPARDVTACPDCLTPVDRDCRGCGRPGAAGLRTFGFRAWLELARQPCRVCAHRFPSIATKCPVCLSARS